MSYQWLQFRKDVEGWSVEMMDKNGFIIFFRGGRDTHCSMQIFVEKAKAYRDQAVLLWLTDWKQRTLVPNNTYIVVDVWGVARHLIVSSSLGYFQMNATFALINKF